MYKYEMHSHTNPASLCSQVAPRELVAAYKQKGYSGVVITNHYMADWFEIYRKDKDRDFEESLNAWLSDYRTAKKEGDACGLDVLLGAELRFRSTGANDYLFYGFDEDFLFANPKLYDLTPKEMHRLARENGCYFGQAHPCREGCYPVEAEYLDGMEVYNGHPSAANHMDKTYDIVKKNNLLTTCGTDFHELKNAGKAAVLLPERVGSSKRFADMLFCDRQLKFIIPDDVKNDRSLPFWSDDRYISALQAEE